MGFDDAELTLDKFLDGQLNILQPSKGYRAGVDPVFLAAATDANAGQSVLELGCGVGVASLCLARRVPSIDLTGVELQPDYSELAIRNAKVNNIEMTVITADLCALPDDVLGQTYDHVIANPPYYERSKGTAAPNSGKDVALAGETPLNVWLDVATKRLKPGGYLTLIQKADRLQDVLQAMDQRLGDVLVQPLAPRTGRAAELCIVRARKNARGAFKLAAPIILHIGTSHTKDGESYHENIRQVLRNGAALDLNG